MSVSAAYARHAGSQLLQVQQHVADMQVKADLPPVAHTCIMWFLPGRRSLFLSFSRRTDVAHHILEQDSYWCRPLTYSLFAGAGYPSRIGKVPSWPIVNAANIQHNAQHCWHSSRCSAVPR